LKLMCDVHLSSFAFNFNLRLYITVITQLQQIIPRTVKISDAYNSGSDDEQAFIQNLAIFLTQFFKAGPGRYCSPRHMMPFKLSVGSGTEDMVPDPARPIRTVHFENPTD